MNNSITSQNIMQSKDILWTEMKFYFNATGGNTNIIWVHLV